MQTYTAIGASIVIFAGQSYSSVEETCPNEAIAIVRADWLNRASEIYSEISDDSKSLYGRRSRFDWKEWSISELRREANFYRDALRAEYEHDKRSGKIANGSGSLAKMQPLSPSGNLTRVLIPLRSRFKTHNRRALERGLFLVLEMFI